MRFSIHFSSTSANVMPPAGAPGAVIAVPARSCSRIGFVAARASTQVISTALPSTRELNFLLAGSRNLKTYRADLPLTCSETDCPMV
jgi:hypothetical protein